MAHFFQNCGCPHLFFPLPGFFASSLLYFFPSSLASCLRLLYYAPMLETLLQLLSGRLLVVRAVMIAAAASLITIGMATIYAAGHPAGADGPNAFTYFYDRQMLFVVVASFGLVLASSFSYRLLGRTSYILYGVVLAMLAVLLLARVVNIPFAPVRHGAYRWFRFGGMQLQPSEFCKLAYIMALAWYLRYRTNCRNFFALVGPFVFTLAPMVMILLEPDLGTVLLMMPILFAMLFVAGAKGKHLILILMMAVLATPIFWNFMRGYQRMRVASMLLQNDWLREKAMQNRTLGNIIAGGSSNIRNWQRREGYHLMHSKYAVASGGLTGYGWRNGPYIKYNLLPERHNDFIFSLIAHQWGFIGCLMIFFLYGVIIVCGIFIAISNTDPFGRLVAVGIITMFCVEILVNTSMAVGLMPITGLTLPLISYGGSSLVIHMAAIGLLNNIGRSKPFSVASSPFKYGDDPERL
jgi:rod shape determining protein RodA